MDPTRGVVWELFVVTRVVAIDAGGNLDGAEVVWASWYWLSFESSGGKRVLIRTGTAAFAVVRVVKTLIVVGDLVETTRVVSGDFVDNTRGVVFWGSASATRIVTGDFVVEGTEVVSSSWLSLDSSGGSRVFIKIGTAFDWVFDWVFPYTIWFPKEFVLLIDTSLPFVLIKLETANDGGVDWTQHSKALKYLAIFTKFVTRKIVLPPTRITFASLRSYFRLRTLKSKIKLRRPIKRCVWIWFLMMSWNWFAKSVKWWS